VEGFSRTFVGYWNWFAFTLCSYSNPKTRIVLLFQLVSLEKVGFSLNCYFESKCLFACVCQHWKPRLCSFSLLRSCSGWSHATLPVPTGLLQTDIHSFLGNKPINVWLSFSCELMFAPWISTNHLAPFIWRDEDAIPLDTLRRSPWTSPWLSET